VSSSGYVRDTKDFSDRTPPEEKQNHGIELVKVFICAKWEDVLGAFGLTPLSADPIVAVRKAKVSRIGRVP
jgi:hypothetical protein